MKYVRLFALLIALFIASHSVKAQQAPVPASTAVTVSKNSLSLLTVFSPGGQSGMGFAYRLYTPAGFGGKLGIVSIGSLSLNNPNTPVFVGTGLSYLAYSNKYGYSVTGYLAWRGLNLNDGFQVSKGWNNAIVGVGLNIPLR